MIRCQNRPRQTVAAAGFVVALSTIAATANTHQTLSPLSVAPPPFGPRRGTVSVSTACRSALATSPEQPDSLTSNAFGSCAVRAVPGVYVAVDGVARAALPSGVAARRAAVASVLVVDVHCAHSLVVGDGNQTDRPNIGSETFERHAKRQHIGLRVVGTVDTHR